MPQINNGQRRLDRSSVPSATRLKLFKQNHLLMQSGGRFIPHYIPQTALGRVFGSRSVRLTRTALRGILGHDKTPPPCEIYRAFRVTARCRPHGGDLLSIGC